MLSRGNWPAIPSRIRGLECPRDLDIVVRKLGQKVKIVYHNHPGTKIHISDKLDMVAINNI